MLLSFFFHSRCHAADRIDELLLRASPAGSSSIACDVILELNDLVPPRPEPARRSTRLAQRPRPPPAAQEKDEEPVVDAAQIVLVLRREQRQTTNSVKRPESVNSASKTLFGRWWFVQVRILIWLARSRNLNVKTVLDLERL